MNSLRNYYNRLTTAARGVAVAIVVIFATLSVAAGPVTTDSVSVDIFYRRSSAVFDPSFRSNGASIDSLRAIFHRGDSVDVSHIAVRSGASPEGHRCYNQRLSERRTATALSLLGGLPGAASALTEIVSVGSAGLRASDVPMTDYPDLRISRISVTFKYTLPDSPLLADTTDNTVTVVDVETLPDRADTIAVTDIVAVAAQENKGARNPRFALRSNLLLDAATVPNIGAEVLIGDRWSVGVDAMYAWWANRTLSRVWRLHGGELTVRRYFAEGNRGVHHAGLYGQVLRYDFCAGGRGVLSSGSHAAPAVRPTWGLGAEYGYSLKIAPRFMLDFSLGVGFLAGRYMTYRHTDGHNVWQSTRNRRWIGPTRCGVSLIWIIGKGGDR